MTEPGPSSAGAARAESNVGEAGSTAAGSGSAAITLLVGPSGSGKTSLCARLVEAARLKGAEPAGALCPAVFDRGLKVGIDAVDLAGPSRSERLARRRRGFESAAPGAFRGRRPAPAPDPSDPARFDYGTWSFDAAVLSALDASAQAAIDAGAPLVVVDEIGPLELDYGVGLVRTLEALDRLAAGPAPQGRLSAFVSARPDIAERLARRWPGCGIVTVTVGLSAESLLGESAQGGVGMVSTERLSPARE